MRRLLIPLGFFVILASPVWGAVAFDIATDCGYTETSPQTCDHTTSGSDRMLFACITLFTDTATVNASNPTYNGVAMTLVDSQANASGSLITFLYRLVNPASGTNGYSLASSNAGAFNTLLVSYTGVHQTTPLGTPAKASGESQTPSVDVSSATGEVVIDCMATRDNDPAETPATGSGQTQRATHNTELFWWTKVSEEVGATTVTMDWALDQNNEAWQTISVSLKPATAGSGTRSIVID